MRPDKPGKMDRKHPETTREVIDDLKDMTGDPREVQNEIRYMEPNRDRAVGDADRTGRHFDGEPDEGTEASEEHEAD